MFPDIKCDIKGYSNNNYYLYNLPLVTKYKVLSKQEKGHFNLGPKSVVKNTQLVNYINIYTQIFKIEKKF